MILGIALVIAVIAIIGCIKIKKPAVRGILEVLAAVNIIVVVLGGSFTYVTRLKIHEVASYTSPDGKHELLFQQEGDPDWPFGYTHARLVLKDESKAIVKFRFDVANDGGSVDSDSCHVTWEDTYVEAVISGEEQPDAQYILYFDGETTSVETKTPDGE